jgi:hypothetical protein
MIRIAARIECSMEKRPNPRQIIAHAHTPTLRLNRNRIAASPATL